MVDQIKGKISMTAEKFVRKSIEPFIKRLFKSKKPKDHWKQYQKPNSTS